MAKFFFVGNGKSFFGGKVVPTLLAQKKAIFIAGHLCFCIENNVFNRIYRKCPALAIPINTHGTNMAT